MKMLKELLEKIMAVDLTTAKSTDVPIAEGEELLGVMSDDAKRVWVVYDIIFERNKAYVKSLEDKVRAIREKDKSIRTPEETSLLEGLVVANEEVELARDIVSHAIYQQFPQAALDPRSIEVRADWQIVFLKPEERISTAGHIIIMGLVEPCSCGCNSCCE